METVAGATFSLARRNETGGSDGGRMDFVHGLRFFVDKHTWFDAPAN